MVVAGGVERGEWLEIWSDEGAQRALARWAPRGGRRWHRPRLEDRPAAVRGSLAGRRRRGHRAPAGGAGDVDEHSRHARLSFAGASPVARDQVIADQRLGSRSFRGVDLRVALTELGYRKVTGATPASSPRRRRASAATGLCVVVASAAVEYQVYWIGRRAIRLRAAAVLRARCVGTWTSRSTRLLLAVPRIATVYQPSWISTSLIGTSARIRSIGLPSGIGVLNTPHGDELHLRAGTRATQLVARRSAPFPVAREQGKPAHPRSGEAVRRCQADARGAAGDRDSAVRERADRRRGVPLTQPAGRST